MAQKEWKLSPGQARRLQSAYNLAVGAQLASQAATNTAQQLAAQYEQKVAEIRGDLNIPDGKMEVDLDNSAIRPAKAIK